MGSCNEDAATADTSPPNQRKETRQGKKKKKKKASKGKTIKTVSLHEEARVRETMALVSVIADFVSHTVDRMLPNIMQTVRTAVEESFKEWMNRIDRNVDQMRNVVNRDRVLGLIAQDKQEQYSRHENIRILGIKEKEGEKDQDLIDAVLDMAAAINVPIEAPISAIHRKRRKGSKPRAVIARFTCRRDRDRILSSKKKL